ncbi:MAG TPA: hypothetical protein VHC18_16920 [Amycolatopsis sp.]|nr:hypothetical protein [Amycolatopsis sp.]
MTESNETDDERRAQGLPPAPSIEGEITTPVETPRPVQVSFWLWVVSAVVFVVGYALVFFLRGSIIDQAIKNNTNKAVTADQIRSGTTIVFAIVLVGAVCFAAMYVLFAWKARQGTRSARTVLTVLMAIALIVQLFLGLGSIPTLLGTLIGLVALVLMYLPKVAPFFPKVSRRNR